MKRIALLVACVATALWIVAIACCHHGATGRRATDKIRGKGFYYPNELKHVKRPHPLGDNVVTFAEANPDSEFADEAMLVVASRLGRPSADRSRPRTKRATKALKMLDTIIQNNRHAAFCNFFRLRVVPETSRKKVLAKYREYVRYHPNYSADIAMRMKALLYEKLGERQLGIELLERYVRKYPQGRWAAEDSAFFKEETMSVWWLVRRTDERIFYELARMYVAEQEYAKAATVLRQAIAVYSELPVIVFYYDLLARTYEKASDPANERRALRALQEHPVSENGGLMARREWNDPIENASLPGSHVSLRSREAVADRLRELIDADAKGGSHRTKR